MAIPGINNSVSSYATPTQSKTEEITNRFTALLVAQLKNQDPMSPMDPTQMTGQMASLEQLSQMTQMKGSIDSLVSLLSNQSGMQNVSSVVDFLGKHVTVSKDAYSSSDILEALLDKAGNYQLNIDGNKTIDLSLNKGTQSFDLSSYINDSLAHKVNLYDSSGNNIPLGINAAVSEVYMNPSRVKISSGEILSASNIIKVAS